MDKNYIEEYKSVLRDIFSNKDRLNDFIRFCSRGNICNLDLEEIIFLYKNEPNVSVVHTYVGWSNVNMQVLRGTKGIKISSENLNFYEDKNTNKKNKYIFDISQTTVKKGAEEYEKEEDYSEFLDERPKYTLENILDESEKQSMNNLSFNIAKKIVQEKYLKTSDDIKNNIKLDNEFEIHKILVESIKNVRKVREIVTELNINKKSTRDEYSENDIYKIYVAAHPEIRSELKEVLSCNLNNYVKNEFVKGAVKRTTTYKRDKVTGSNIEIKNVDNRIYAIINGEKQIELNVDRLRETILEEVSSDVIKSVSVGEKEKHMTETFKRLYEQYIEYVVLSKIINSDFLLFVNNSPEFNQYFEKADSRMFSKVRNNYTVELTDFDKYFDSFNNQFIDDEKVAKLLAIQFHKDENGIVNGKLVNYKMGIPSEEIKLDENTSEVEIQKEKGIIDVAIESTEDYVDSDFHKELVDINVQNEDGTYGKMRDFYRLVKIGDDGLLIPVDNKVYLNFDEARNGIDTEKYSEISYDDIVYRAALEHEKHKIETQHLDEKVTNFSYDKNWSLSSGLKQKFYDNIEAISILKMIENEERTATPDEQMKLSRYIGWGGLAAAFDSSKKDWEREYNILKESLSDIEYEAAKDSVNTAFYTNNKIIEAIYQGLQDMGFTGGNILEPSCGVGNFISAMPGEIRKKSKIYGVELDNISGRIAKVLHPDANISLCGFEETEFSDNSFDVVVGNIPFGDYGVFDKKYAKKNFKIHDYFIAKSLDVVRPGGIVAVITSTGTLDKSSTSFRKYVAERADLLGAIRLPNTAFKDSNTSVTSDILFLKKRDSVLTYEPEWIYTGVIDYENNISTNLYFHNHRSNLLGILKKDNRFGNDGITYLEPKKGFNLESELNLAISSLKFSDEYESSVLNNNLTDTDKVIPAFPDVKNFTYCEYEGKVFYKNNSVMEECKLADSSINKIKSLIEIKDIAKSIINTMINDESEDELSKLREKLNLSYDKYVEKNGYINENTTRKLFGNDVEYSFLCSLENAKDKKYEKADIFYKRTIKKAKVITECGSAIDALTICIGEKVDVDIKYIKGLLPKYNSYEEIIDDLEGEIFLDPLKANDEDITIGWVSKEEYLSGNVREKLEEAKLYNINGKYDDNIKALEKVIPVDIKAAEITCNIGVPWIEINDYVKFMEEFFKFRTYDCNKESITKYEADNLYHIKDKPFLTRRYSSASQIAYGTYRKSGFEIFEDLLNNKVIEVRDRIEEDGKVKYIRNVKETQYAQDKAEIIQDNFKEWIFKDIDRREHYVEKYNKLFNSDVVRVYDGRNIELPNHSLEIELREHQKNAVARIVRGGNTLLAHCVGAGKTYCIIAGAMELKRLGFANKPMIVVPSHLTSQMASEFMKLYPSANVLLTTTKDFEKHNRKVFVSKIATGDYDAVIIGHSQFDLIPVSTERQKYMIEKEKEELTNLLTNTVNDNITVKQLNSKLRKLDVKLKKLMDSKKDDQITFEELGVDALFVDEAHEYKNLSFNTRLGNSVSGLNTNGSEKAYDMYMKVQYIQEKTQGRNIVFATGTPVSNSLAEMYTMQKYLGNSDLQKKGLLCFDAWAVMFGKIETSWEIAPEGGGNTYRPKTRFAHFNNIAELNKMYRRFADVKMADSLELNVPKLKNNEYTIIETQLSAAQREYMNNLMERAEEIRSGGVDSSVDNMLKICNEARLIAADLRLIFGNDIQDKDFIGYTKLDAVVDKVYELYNAYNKDKGVQAIMSDIGTPKKDAFNVYDYIREQLVKKGIPEDEIKFIHEAKSDNEKKVLFEQCRQGKCRVIIGSTSKMGTGTNIQDRLCAMHEIDVPWRPSDVEQREGRIIRQGNMYDSVEICRYITKDTFDSYNWNVIEKKQRYISQIMTSDTTLRECEDIDETTMSYAQMKAICSGNPDILREIEVETEIAKIKSLKIQWQNEKDTLNNKINRTYPDKIREYKTIIANYTEDINKYKEYCEENKNETNQVPFVISVGRNVYTNREEAGKEILRLSHRAELGVNTNIGFYKNFQLKTTNINNGFGVYRDMIICGQNNYHIDITSLTEMGICIAIENKMKKFEDEKINMEEELERIEGDLEKAKIEYNTPFAHEERYNSLLKEQGELQDRLYVFSKDKSDNNMVQTSEKDNERNIRHL